MTATDPEHAVKHEPTADQRTIAGVLFGLFTALVDEGFSEQQALIIIGQMLAANAKGETP